MKRRDLIKRLEANGWRFLRHGGNHDIYTNGTRTEPISHAREIDEILAKKILKRNGINIK
ncbi:MAG: type II toxin-antitoxin system HicA family toxin [Defluviitaleaceae bacterium]|nr:type II toxin-antitoxin system HicA family toxin [Defluviitaleaceae bacterium]